MGDVQRAGKGGLNAVAEACAETVWTGVWGHETGGGGSGIEQKSVKGSELPADFAWTTSLVSHRDQAGGAYGPDGSWARVLSLWLAGKNLKA